MKFRGVTTTIAIAWAGSAPSPSLTRMYRATRFAHERRGRDDEKADALVGDVAALAPERPEPVPCVVARNRDEEGADGGGQVVHVEHDLEEGVHAEVDEVAAEAHDAEPAELLPVAATLDRDAHAAGGALAGGSRRRLDHVRRG